MVCAQRMAAVVGLAAVVGVGAGGASVARAQIAYGVSSASQLFRFDVSTPGAPVTPIGFFPGDLVTEAIDFRPGTNELYGIDVGPNTTQLYQIDTNTAALTPVGAAFPSVGVNYNLTQGPIGFDFNPTTLQADNSMRIRVVAANSTTNLRLNSATGQISAVDTDLLYAGGNVPFIDSAAYVNNFSATSGGATTLYGIDVRNNALVTINPPNAGTVNTVGSLGVTVVISSGVGFDVLSTGNDPTLADDFGYAVIERGAVSGGAYLLYNVDLTTGLISNGALVGGGAGMDFSGGFAVAPVPEPARVGVLAGAGLLVARRRARK